MRTCGHLGNASLPHRTRSEGDSSETAVYFCCLEAIQNAIKHSGATRVIVELVAEADHLYFSVRDEGCGFDVAAVESSGLENLADRLAAVAGRFHINSITSKGTTVAGHIPLDLDKRNRRRIVKTLH